jgi:pantoate--beta-alanine ligase
MTMQIVSTINEVRAQVKEWKREGLIVGFVPTMGYLHEGHASLMKRARLDCDKVVASIFVNPMQFGANEDLDSYPRDLEADAKLCESIGVDLIFHPEVEEMYADGFCSFVDMNGLTKELCGKSRPIHFRGVCTVVSKLFHIVTPDKAFFGQKDAQQLAVIRRMVKDLNMDIEVVGCPIVREEDGLAKSSRNTYLNEEERKAALILSKTIRLGEKLAEDGMTNAKELVAAMKENLEKEPMAKIDYVEAVSMDTIEKVDKIEGNVLVAMAVYIGKTRLIDNFIIGGEKNADTGIEK